MCRHFERGTDTKGQPIKYSNWDIDITHSHLNYNLAPQRSIQQEYIKKRCSQNVISAYVHMDETTPHMHFTFIPVTYDPKKGYDKVSAKEVLTRLDLRTFHGDLDAEMSQVFGRDIGVLNKATKLNMEIKVLQN